MAPRTVEYFAVSVLSSRTMWLNAVAFVIAALTLTEVVTIIPPRLLPLYSAGLAVLNLGLRTITYRPVAFIAPGEVKAVQVEKIDPPAPPFTD